MIFLLFSTITSIRILPHLQDTGGFFVAVLRKTASKLPWESVNKDKNSVVHTPMAGESESQASKEADRDRSVVPRKKRRIQGYKEDPFVFLPEDDEIWKAVRDFFKVDSSFPNLQLLGRCQQENKRNIYLVSKAVKNIIETNGDKIKVGTAINAKKSNFQKRLRVMCIHLFLLPFKYQAFVAIVFKGGMVVHVVLATLTIGKLSKMSVH